MYCWGNVPPQFLEREIAPHSDLALWHLLISPRLEVLSLDVEGVGEGAYKVRLVAPEHRLAADERDREGGRAEGGAAGRGGADAAGGRVARHR